jgi:hypothetical protein
MPTSTKRKESYAEKWLREAENEYRRDKRIIRKALEQSRNALINDASRWREAQQLLAAHPSGLNDWEKKFINGLANFEAPTPRQISTLRGLIFKCSMWARRKR